MSKKNETVAAAVAAETPPTPTSTCTAAKVEAILERVAAAAFADMEFADLFELKRQFGTDEQIERQVGRVRRRMELKKLGFSARTHAQAEKKLADYVSETEPESQQLAAVIAAAQTRLGEIARIKDTMQSNIEDQERVRVQMRSLAPPEVLRRREILQRKLERETDADLHRLEHRRAVCQGVQQIDVGSFRGHDEAVHHAVNAGLQSRLIRIVQTSIGPKKEIIPSAWQSYVAELAGELKQTLPRLEAIQHRRRELEAAADAETVEAEWFK